jgi:hypothetical protein
MWEVSFLTDRRDESARSPPLTRVRLARQISIY